MRVSVGFGKLRVRRDGKSTPSIFLVWACAWAFQCSTAAEAAAPALTAPPAESVTEGRAIVDEMIRSPKGPYSRIVWFCADGSIQPPKAYGCREHGGGRQHAEYSKAQTRLAELGWPVGTVVAALSFEEFWDGERRHRRMRDLPVEKHLVQTMDGWVLRKARYYRGRVQVQDEEAAGRALLGTLLERPEWVAENFLLVRELTRSLPHDAGVDRTREVRRMAETIAAADTSFQRLRIKIHGSPDASDAALVRKWSTDARKRGSDSTLVQSSRELAAALDDLFSAERRNERLSERIRALRSAKGGTELASALAQMLATTGEERHRLGAEWLVSAREAVCAPGNVTMRLLLLDASVDVEGEILQGTSDRLATSTLTRSELFELARVLGTAAYGAGFLSASERAAVEEAIAPATNADSLDASEYAVIADVIRRTTRWAMGTVQWTFGESVVAFAALEPEAEHFFDEVLRSSAVLVLADVARRLTLDAQRGLGVTHRVLGRDVGGVLGINPGLATGPLVLLAEGAKPTRDDIVVLRRTTSSLDPVAGILTLEEGNLLSHVQILARNLGIPNVALAPGLRETIEAADGVPVVLAVAADGSVLLERRDAVRPAVASLLERGRPPAEKMRAPQPDLRMRDPLELRKLRASLAGRVVGPKAANLGELASHFPDAVAPAIALPFGIFAQHAVAVDPPKAALDEACRRFRAGEIDEAECRSVVDSVRRSIGETPLSDELKTELAALLETTFGESGSYGVFVRSDTNVEDLPGFTGAGLNLTIPHVVGSDAILAAIPRVWASPFGERPMKWRETLLERPEDVFTSVLLMKSVPVDKSGVLVTTDLIGRGDGYTVATAWGVGGAVDNEVAETLVLRPDGRAELVGEAKASWCRRLRASGGVDWVPAAMGAVLTESDRRQLLELVARVDREFEPARGDDGRALPWDIEFGFLDGTLQLFQIRPLVERGSGLATSIVRAARDQASGLGGRVSLEESP